MAFAFDGRACGTSRGVLHLGHPVYTVCAPELRVRASAGGRGPGEPR